MKIQKQLDLTGYHAKDGFIRQYQKLVHDVVIPYQYDILNDQMEGAAKSHAIANFINAGKVLRGEDPGDGFYGMVFQDSDVAKWLEAVAFSLSVEKDPELETIADRIIDIVAEAQDKNGYLNTYYTIKDQDKRWTNLLEGHELYCSGHMMEAAVAYYEATGKDVLLNVMLRNAKHIYNYFIEEAHEGYPGHPEVELALLKMYRATKDPICLALAKHFIDCRGVDPHYYEKEAKNRGWFVWGGDGKDLFYQQSDKPVRELSNATGHSVRAVYLYTAMADLASEIGDDELLTACKRLWESITKRQMYITGGIGSTVHGEAFTTDYDLPNDTAYSETCAAIGLMYFASRMLENEPDGRYADIIERSFYNTVLAGMQMDGKRFFYVNPLEIIPGISGAIATHRHTLPVRPQWYACACCPPNVARTINSIGKYAYGENETTLFCHMFMDGEVYSKQSGLSITCETSYPYGMDVTYKVTKGNGILSIHIPSWSDHTVVKQNLTCILNGKAGECQWIKQGYLYLNVKSGDCIKIQLDSSVRRTYASTKVAANTGKVAFERGPLVYCFEGIDHEGDVLSLSVKEDASIRIVSANDYHINDVHFKSPAQVNTLKAYFDKLIAQNAILIKIEGVKTVLNETDELYSSKKPLKLPYTLTAVPYYTWGNRGENQMRVWIPEID